MKLDFKDLSVRFLIGGSAVALSYVIAAGSPWNLLGGSFAAFPAVMISAIIITGMRHGSEQAGEIARGAVFGMIGGVFCIIATLLGLIRLNVWLPSFTIGIAIWLTVSFAIYRLSGYIRKEP